MSALEYRPRESADGFRAGKAPQKIIELKSEFEKKKQSVARRTMRGQIFASHFGADLYRRFKTDGLRGAAGAVIDTAKFEYRLRSRDEGVGVVETETSTLDLAAGMQVLGLMTGLIMLSVGLLVYSETQAAMPTPEDQQLANASTGLNDTAVSVVNLSKVAFIIGAAAIMIGYLVGGLGGMGGGGGLQ